MSRDYKRLYDYYKGNYKRYVITLNKKKDFELIEKLEKQENKTEFIKKAIMEK